MTHRFPIKEIAHQAGLSTATVDRVINNRAHVSPQTRKRVAGALAELEGQESQLAARGRRMFIDFVIEAPTRFSREVQKAAQLVAPGISSAVCRPRFVMQEIMSEEEMVASLARIAKRGSQGVCLKARDLPSIRKAIDRLADAGIPVVTLVTDVLETRRVAYAGLDNQSAGQTAAYLLAQTLGDDTGVVLATKSQDSFLGEEERATAFRATLAKACPNLTIIEASGGSGVPSETGRAVQARLDDLGSLVAVYSMGGGNQAILDVLAEHRLTPHIFIAHDLDRENRNLLQTGRISFVLYHDLQNDVQNAYHAILKHHQLVPEIDLGQASSVQIITPMNMS